MSTFTRANSCWKLLVISLICWTLAIASAPGVDISQSSESLGTAGFRFKRSERCLMRKVNAIRGRYGLNRLERDKQLAYVARRHAMDMASTNYVFHDDNLASKVTRWYRLGQNTGRGRSCRSLANAFMNSAEHRANILGAYKYMGFGTQKRWGRVYVQQIFESRRDPGNIYRYP